MAHDHKFRFAAQLGKAPEGTARSWAEQARRAEDLGYSTLFMPDHFGDQLAPVPALAAVAAATTTLRMGSLVFGNDYRHPVNLAKEAATLDVLSDGRFELSLGAGWMRTDYEEAGIAYDEPRIRVERFEEAVAVLQGLLRTDGAFSFDGRYYQVHEHAPPPPSRAAARAPADHRGRWQTGAVVRGAPRRHRQHQRQPPARDRRAGDGPERIAGPDTARRWPGSKRPPATGSTTSSSTPSSGSSSSPMTPPASPRPWRPFRHRPGRGPPHPVGPARHARRDGRGVAVASRGVRHLVLVDRGRQLGGARAGGLEAFRDMTDENGAG